jgi:OmpR-family two-component system manganese-sensing response regulator
MIRMLIAEGDECFANAWRELFLREQYDVVLVDSKAVAREQLRGSFYDVIILQTAASDIDGIELCQSYRRAGGSSPVLLTSSKHSSEEMERGLGAGADDYMSQPILLRELLARIRALLRRPAAIVGDLLQVDDVILDCISATAFAAGKELHLQPMELNLLEFLMRHPNQVFTADALVDRVWKDRTKASRGSLRTHFKTLRQKLTEMGSDIRIVTVRGRGYKLLS